MGADQSPPCSNHMARHSAGRRHGQGQVPVRVFTVYAPVKPATSFATKHRAAGRDRPLPATTTPPLKAADCLIFCNWPAPGHTIDTIETNLQVGRHRAETRRVHGAHLSLELATALPAISMTCRNRFSDSRDSGGWFAPAAPLCFPTTRGRRTSIRRVRNLPVRQNSPLPRRERGALDPCLLRR
jgi:hypothetical protein